MMVQPVVNNQSQKCVLLLEKLLNSHRQMLLSGLKGLSQHFSEQGSTLKRVLWKNLLAMLSSIHWNEALCDAHPEGYLYISTRVHLQNKNN